MAKSVVQQIKNLTPLKQDTIKGGEIISRMLATEGVDSVFGIIDGTYQGLITTLGKHGISLYTPRHEATSMYMAGTYARITGKLGVAIASNGPGVANVISGVAVENAEGNRVLLITSSRRLGLNYPDRGGAYQVFPHVDVIRPMSKWAAYVPSVERLPELMRAALRMAYTGRPGVVYLDVPEDILNADVEVQSHWFREPSEYRVLAPLPAPPEQIKEAAMMIRQAKRPVIHAGSGVMHACAGSELARLAALIQAPVTTSWGARCTMDERMPESVSMVFVDAVNTARKEADLALVVGSRLGETDWWGKAPYWGTPQEQKLIQVDIDPSILGLNRPTNLAIQADAKRFLSALCDELEASGPIPVDIAESRREQLNKLNDMKTKRRKKLDEALGDMSVPMNPAQVPTIAAEVFDDDAILILDGGNTAIWGNFYHIVRTPHTMVSTPKMGMLGAGVGQTLGAKVAAPDRQVYCLIGDGAMGFHQQEIETAVRNELNVIWIVFCDRQWGMVKINQSFAMRPIKTLIFKKLDPKETVNTELHETRFDDLARAMGAHGERVSDPKGLRAAIERSLAAKKPAVIQVDVDPVKHMWAPNLKTFKDMHAEPAGK